MEKPDFLTEERLQEDLKYLDELREEGVTNMFGAGPYLQAYDSDLSRRQARAVLLYWMETFGERHPVGEGDR